MSKKDEEMCDEHKELYNAYDHLDGDWDYRDSRGCIWFMFLGAVCGLIALGLGIYKIFT